MPNFHKMIRVAFAVVVLTQGISCGTEKKRSMRTGTPRASVRFPTDGQLATVKSDANGVMVASIDPNSTLTQIVKASQSSRIKDYSVAFPPGAIGISTDIFMAEGEGYSSEELLSTIGVAGGTGILGSSPPVSITASSPIDLAVPMIVALSLPSATSLIDEPLPLERMGVVFRVTVQATGERLAGVIPAQSLTIQGNRVLYPSKYFGWFQVTIFDKPIQETKQKDSKILYQAVSIIPAGQPLPSCGPADLGRAIYSQEKSTFLYCLTSGWTPINLQGAQGPQGVPGPQGSQGATGPQGAQGAAGTSANSSGFSVYDAEKRRMGALLGFAEGTYYLGYSGPLFIVALGTKSDSNLGYVGIRADTSGYMGGMCVNNNNHFYFTGKSLCYCLYDNSSCSSDNNKCNVAGKLYANSIFYRADGSWVRSSGGGTAVSGTAMTHYYDGTGCKPLGSYYQTSSYYEVTTPYSFPSGGATIPTSSLPLSIDP